jgi:hypothetical protein
MDASGRFSVRVYLFLFSKVRTQTKNVNIYISDMSSNLFM